MRTLVNDLRFSLRLLAKTPGFSLICLVVITLGLAVAISNYSFLREFTKAPDFPEGERFFGVKVFNTESGLQANTHYFNGYAVNAIRESVTGFEVFGAYTWVTSNVLSRESVSKRNVVGITPNLLPITGVKPLLGRLITADDLQNSDQAVVMISHSLWRQEFAADPNAVGQRITIDGVFHTIVGVMPEGFHYPFAQDVWRPIRIPENPPATDATVYALVGKIKPSASFDSASREVNAAIQRLRTVMPQSYNATEVEVVPLNAMKAQGTAGIRELLIALTVVVFLLASLNLSTLLFSRSTERTQELAVRNAMGASAWQIRKQVLLESGVLCLFGCALAIVVSEVLLRSAQLMLTSMMASLDVEMDFDFRIHRPAVVYALVITSGIWLLSSFVTAYRISGRSLHQSLEGGSKGTVGRSAALTTRLVVAVEIVFSCFLLIICGLLTVSIINAYNTDFGIDAENRYIGELIFGQNAYQDIDEQQTFLNDLRHELSSRSSIDTVSFTNSPPGGWSWPDMLPFSLADRDLRRDGAYPSVLAGLVSEGYFEEMGIKLIEGREFTRNDNADSNNVVIIDELLAESLWPAESALGKRIQLDPEGDGEWLDIVGVNTHTIHAAPVADIVSQPAIYRPLGQKSVSGQLYVVVRLDERLSVSELTRLIRESMGGANREVALENVMPIEDFMPQGLSGFHFIGQVMSWFTFVTLLLSIIGVYGIISRSVFLRSREIGIRRALGSSKARVAAIFLRQGVVYLVIGAVVGGGSAILMSGVMTIIFPNILDGLAIVGLTVLSALGFLVFLASYFPARRAVGTEPGDALRSE